MQTVVRRVREDLHAVAVGLAKYALGTTMRSLKAAEVPA